MKSLGKITSQLPKLLVVVLFLTLAPAALASNTWYVDGVNGNDGNDCKTAQTACKTIGHALSLCSSGDTIMVAPATYIENLTINFSLKIIGYDASTTIVDGGGVSTVFTISSTTANVVLSKLTIRNGNAPEQPNNEEGGGIYNSGALTINYSIISGNSGIIAGGGIFNDGTATINKSTISGNWSEDGGGIWSQGTLTINRSTITANSSYNYAGVLNSGTATINNSTISGNSPFYGGGGITTEGPLMVNNSTISGNSGRGGDYGPGGIWRRWPGSAILQNTIVANNPGGNCYGTMISDGYNLSSDNTCRFNGPGDMNKTKPKLGTLGNHGGPTQTVSELPGSPTIDAGNPNGCTYSNGKLLTTDQRGYPRPGKHKTDQRCDMGAFEMQTD